ncbi:Neurobeachin-like protein 1 [Phytophthora ramorum]|uniref:Neurobeachin-like protein 1 n=1 Tax=Phytophthora ramorum TaxID=164328 RepID=UPI0030B78536|nr:Neurobeachin-like protein 1 [Phytophthora ramorum]
MELTEPTDTVSVFLLELLGGKEYSDAEATRLQIRRPSRLKALFSDIVGVLDESEQIRALEALISLVRSSCGNVEACSTAGLQREILRFLSERGLFADPSLPHTVLKKLLRVFLYLAYHSVSMDDIQAMLAVFRSMRMVHEEPDDEAVSYYLSTLEMIARDSFGPASFFDLNGEFSGLLMPVLPAFPNNGYTFCAWIKFEYLPEEVAPLFTFCGKTGVGIMCSFLRSSLMITSFDKRKNDGHVEVPDLVTPGRWHFLCITHTHRQFRGSKLDVYLNAELRQSVRLAYPNTALMAPVVKAYLAMRESNGSNALRILLGPTALFGQALPASIINNIRSVDEYDALVFQFNSYISSSSTSSSAGVSGAPGTPGGSNAAGNSTDGLLLAYDARHCDRLKGLCYDSSGNDYHAAAASAGVRLRHAGTFKQAVAQLGGPLVCLPLLVTSTTAAVSTVNATTPDSNGDDTSETSLSVRSSLAGTTGVLTTQFDEDADFLKQMSDLIARPMGVHSIPKVVLLIAEIMRHSLVNKFIFRRSQGVRLMALLMRSLPPRYLTADLLIAIERLRSAVISDRILADEIYKFLLFNFRVWVNAPVDLQSTVFDKLEIMTRKDSKNLSPASTRHFLRCLSWIYWRIPTSTTLRRAREFSPEEVDLLRKRVLAMIKIVLCESPPAKIAGSVMPFPGKGKEVKSQLSYESTRSLIFCMIGKPSNPMIPGMNIDGTPTLQEIGPSNGSSSSATVSSSSTSKSMPESDLDGSGSAIENVPETDLPDLLQLLIELSVQPTAPAGMLDLFGRLGGLRIWLPLLEFSNDVIRVMTLRLLRTYLFLKCDCSQDREMVNNPDKIQLSVGDAYLIMHSLKPEERPVSMGVYSEILLMILGIQVTEKNMKALDGKTAAYDSLIDENVLATATIWHDNMMSAFLGLVRSSSVTIRMVAIRHLKIIFASSTVASAINRHVLIFGSISSMGGTATESSTTEQVPIIEAILSLRGDPQRQYESPLTPPSSLFGIELHGCPGVPMSRLRDMVLNTQEPDEVRVNALFSIITHDDVDFVRGLLALHGDGDRKKQGVSASCFNDMSSRMKLALVELMSVYQPSGCVDFITLMSYDVISSMICLEVKTNEMAWFLLQDPFTTLSRFITSTEELEVVVVSLLKTTLDKMNEMLSAEMNLRINEGTPSRESILWRNAESLASLAAAVVLHYDPDTLGDVDPSKLMNGSGNEDVTKSLVFWKCERAIWHEAELVDSILGIWQHFASHFHSESDASFARRSSNAHSRRGSTPPRPMESGLQSPPPLGSSARSNAGTSMLGFGFNLLPTGAAPNAPVSNSPPPPLSGGSNISARPHPGGPMRQILQLLLRCLYLVLISDDNEAAADSEDDNDELSSAVKLRLPANSVFFARINKLEYFINAMGLGHELAQFDSCFAPSRSGSNGMTTTAGLVTASECVKAAPGDETTLLLWLIPELSSLIGRVRRKCWSESAVKLASILASLVSVPLRSSDQLAELLARNDFATNNQEVRRRDCFYHEQMAHARDIRAMRRVGMFDEEADEKNRAKAELERISNFTRSAKSLGAPSSDGEDHVWLERVKAKDIDDWMKLRVLAKWGVRHVWGVKDEAVLNAVGDGTIIGLWGDNEFWRVDIYTSSNWIRCRLLPDTDDTITHNYSANLTSSSLKHEMLNNMTDELTMPPVDSIVVDNGVLAASGDSTDQLLEEEEDDDDTHTADSGGDGEGSEAAESDDPGYVGLARRMSDVGYLDDDNSPTSLDASGSSNDNVPRSMLRDRMHSSDSVGEIVDASSRLDVIGQNPELVSTAPIAPPPPELSENVGGAFADDSPIRDRRAVSVDVATTVKSAKGRIGTISTRLSSGIMRLAGGRPTTLSGSFTGPENLGPHRSLSNVSEDGGDMQDSTSPDTAGEENSARSNDATKPASPPGPSSAGPTSSSRMLKNPSKHDHWKTLGAPYRTKAYLVLPSGVLVHGVLRIGAATIVFEGERVVTLRGIADAFKSNDDGGVAARQRNAQRLHEVYVSQLKRRVWGVRVIRVIHRRRFLMEGQNGLEIYFVDGSSCFFGLESYGEADLMYATLKERKPPCLAKWGKRLLSAERMFSKSKWTEMWVRREISNFEYLMALNVSAGRSYNDAAQYPVFPWVIKDYESAELRLDDEDIYRDLRRPIGAQTTEAIQRARATYEGWDPKTPIPAFHYANTYSHMQSVLYFLIRLAPFTGAVLGSEEQQLHHMAAGEPTFDSVPEAFQMCTSDDRHMFELTPEFFYLPELFSSARNKTLARHFAPGQDVSATAGLKREVSLPPWAASPYDFVRLHRLALESDFVSSNLHHWIDLIFGYKQTGSSAVDALNSYHIACYPERLDLSTSSDGVRAKLVQRGTVPVQLFRKPHPVRMTQDESLEARYPASHSMAVLSSRRQVRRHDLPSKHAAAVKSVRFSNALNHAVALTALTGSGPGLGSGTGMGAHSTSSNDHGVVVYTTDSDGVVLAKRYLNSVPDTVRSCPFSMVDVDQWWKLPAGCLVSEGVVFYEQMISCGYWDGSWRIHWAADGELLQRIAFHKKPILCMARSEDDFTGDLALAFGSEDCTVSIWALSKLSASRSRRLFLKKELPVGGLPWVLLVGHTSPVVAVSLNVDLDVVVSASKNNMLLLHSLRGSTPLHALALTPGPMETSAVAHMVISAQGDTLVHSITTHKTQRSGRYSRANSLFSDDKARLTVGETGSGNSSMVAGGLSSSGYVATSDLQEQQQDGSERQSELYVVSINGHVISHDKLVSVESVEGENDLPPVPHLLLERGVLFTRSGEYLITACTGADAAIEVRDAGMPGSVVRRIECKRPGVELTSLSMGQDERCIVCGYADGAVVAYALHFGVADGCKSLVGLDKKARERERAALAQATKRDLLRNKRREELLPAFMRGNGGAEGSCLWSRQGKSGMPEEPYITNMQERFALLKQNCVSGDEKYEEMLRDLWHAIYSQQQFNKENAASTEQPQPIAEGNLLDFGDDAKNGDDAADPEPAQGLQFERVGESWSRLGFQRPDPTTDFRAGGMLSLDCLVYFASHYTAQAVRMVTNQVPGSHDHTYPWGPAGINVTCMVARLFWKFDGELVREQQANWPLFYDSEAFHLLFSEVFVLFDYLWNEMNANYGNFSVVIQATSDRIMDVLEEAQGDINVVLMELRSQSLSTMGKQRRASSRSMEDFLTTINTNITDASAAVNDGLTASDGSSFPPSTPPSKSPRSSWSFSSRLGLGSSGSSATTTEPVLLPGFGGSESPKPAPIATTNTLVPDVSDPFAGNDIRGFEEKPPSPPPVQSDDPFACLL